MDNDTSNRETCKNISESPFLIVEEGDRQVDRDVTSQVTARDVPSPGRSQSTVRRLQSLLANVEEIERNRKRRPAAALTPKGQFGGPNQHQPAYLDEIATTPEPTAQEFRDLRRKTLSLSREQCGKLLHLHKGTIEGWEYGLRRIPFSAFLVLRLLSLTHRSATREAALDRSPSGVAEYPPKSEVPLHVVPLAEQSRFIPRRQRAMMLQARMHQFTSIYNAAWFVRDAAFGTEERKKGAAQDFAAVLLRELWDCDDPEALIYAVADSLTLSPYGVPWEG